MDNQRMFLFVALALVVMLLWQAWEQEKQRQQPAPAPAATQPPAERGIPVAPPAPASTPTPAPRAGAAAQTLPRAQRIRVVTDLFEAQIDTSGGDLRELHLRKYPVSVDRPDIPFRLLNDEGDDVFVSQSGLIGNDPQLPNHKTEYRAKATQFVLADGENELRVPLTWRSASDMRYTKTYVFHRDSYTIDVEFTVENNTRRTWNGYMYGQFVRSSVEHKGWMTTVPSYMGGAIYTNENKYEKIGFKDMADKDLGRNATGGWVAMMQHYFVASWMPRPDERNRFYSSALGQGRYAIGYQNLMPLNVERGNNGVLSTQLYVGPKEHKRLVRLIEGMDLTVDFGWLTVISAPLFWLLVFIHDWVGNWGWAIIILTILIKLVFFPLSAASYKSMANMRRLQPKLQSLKERYGQDRQRLNQAMMELYKTEKINPLGGCLPILIQIPVFIALYWVLLESVEMRQAPFALWLKDLSSPDPYYVLPIIMGVTMFLQQLLNPSPLDPIQKKVMMALPFMFTIFFLFFPAGLVLYWVVNNVLSIAQQWQITRMIEGKSK